jgi:hypothetical protein
LSVTLKSTVCNTTNLAFCCATCIQFGSNSKRNFQKKLKILFKLKQGDLKPEETKRNHNLSQKAFSPIGKDADEQAGAIGNATNANEVKGNINAPDKLLKEAQKASETVEKITATATRELREKLDSVDIYGFTYFRQKRCKDSSTTL